MSEHNETLLTRLRAAISGPRSANVPRVPDPVQDAQIREAVSRLARSRVSATLRQLRAARALSYETVRERTGLSQQLLYDMEYGERRLPLVELPLLSQCSSVAGDCSPCRAGGPSTRGACARGGSGVGVGFGCRGRHT